MKTACLYSIIRYLPYTETEEFANIGILLCCPKRNFLSFRLSPRTNKRVSSFFNDSSIYVKAREYFSDELKFVRNQAAHLSVSDTAMANFFLTYISRKESIFQFSDVRSIISESPEKELELLYNKFIHLSEVTQESREAILAKELRTRFKLHAELANAFKPDTIGGDLSKFSMPLVLRIDNQIGCAIKPLAFDQTEPGKMIEHCDTWVSRIGRAASEGLVDIKNVLLPLDSPTHDSPKRLKAMDVIRSTLRSHDIKSVDYSDQDYILKFAKSSI